MTLIVAATATAAAEVAQRHGLARHAFPWPCQDIRALAAVYAHRPGYNPGWAPDPAIV